MPRVVIRNRESLRVEDVFIVPSVFGTTWYVDTTNGNDTNTGKDPNDAFKTLDKAKTSSAAGDTIVIAPGTYTQTAAEEPLTPLKNQHWVAAVPGRGGRPTVIITGTAEAVVVDLAVDGVFFEGIHFQADDNAVTELVRIGEGAAVTGGGFIDCMFDGNAKTTVNGLSIDHASQAWTGGVVRGCRFVNCDVGIDVGVSGIPECVIEDNIFDMQDAGGGDVGIALADTTAAATGYGFWIRYNLFIGPPDAGKDAVGITVAGTEDTTGFGGISDNIFSYTGTSPVTIDKIGFSTVRNVYGDATGGLQVDVGT